MRFFPSDATPRKAAIRLLGREGYAERVEARRRLNAEVAAGRAARDEIRDRPEAKALLGGVFELGEPGTPSVAGIVHQRLCFGARPGDHAAFESLGADDDERLENWLDAQLAADPTDPAPAMETSWSLGTLGKTEYQLWHEHYRHEDWEEHIRPLNQTERRTFCRAIHGTRQLQEVVFEFWHNHFSIYGDDVGPMMCAFDRDVVRAHGLGNFRELLGAAVKSWAMLQYLDNKYNSFAPWLENDGINENFARELLELHTLGDLHYWPGVEPADVPDGPGGVKVGYTDADVTQAARCLTGWTTEDAYIWEGFWPPAQYEFSFYENWHDDQNVKTVLGQTIDHLSDADGGTEADGEHLLDLLAAHRGTAVFICGKLVRRLISDDAPASLVESAADVFQAQAAAADQLAQVVRHIVMSTEFRTTFGEKVRRPFEIVVAQMRAANIDFPLVDADTEQGGRAGWFMWQMLQTGHLPFAWGPPNGFPDTRGAWIGSSPRVLTWWFSNFLTHVPDPGGVHYHDIVGETVTDLGDTLENLTPEQIVDYWIERMIGSPSHRQMPSGERGVLVDYMADGASPSSPLGSTRAGSDHRAPAQIRMLVSLMAMSPSFLWR